MGTLWQRLLLFSIWGCFFFLVPLCVCVLQGPLCGSHTNSSFKAMSQCVFSKRNGARCTLPIPISGSHRESWDTVSQLRVAVLHPAIPIPVTSCQGPWVTPERRPLPLTSFMSKCSFPPSGMLYLEPLSGATSARGPRAPHMDRARWLSGGASHLSLPCCVLSKIEQNVHAASL